MDGVVFIIGGMVAKHCDIFGVGATFSTNHLPDQWVGRQWFLWIEEIVSPISDCIKKRTANIFILNRESTKSVNFDCGSYAAVFALLMGWRYIIDCRACLE